VLQLKTSSDLSVGIRSDSAREQLAPLNFQIPSLFVYFIQDAEPVAGMLMSAVSDWDVNVSSQ
jgi:hypothetical protein